MTQEQFDVIVNHLKAIRFLMAILLGFVGYGVIYLAIIAPWNRGK